MSKKDGEVEFGERLTGHVPCEGERGGIGDGLEPKGEKRNREDVAAEKHHESAHDPLERGNFFKNESAKADVQIQKGEHEERPQEEEQRTERSAERNFWKAYEIRPDAESEHGHDDEVRKRSRKHFENLEDGVRNRIEEMYGDLTGLHVFGNPPREIRRTYGSDLCEHESPSEFLERDVREKVRRG